ncbi:helix-turn-helix domain-containing protein [Anaerosolibacter sp.]|uniref:helix-turn-helix domain-containing protein n=1 Tax=Anaerosolibacter sp. TaxID=1872527 RepID=UPI0039EE5B17
MNKFDGLYSFAEAGKKWNLNDSTLRRAVGKRLIEGIDCKKFGKAWIVTEEAMIREYGVPKNQEKNKRKK